MADAIVAELESGKDLSNDAIRDRVAVAKREAKREIKAATLSQQIDRRARQEPSEQRQQEEQDRKHAQQEKERDAASQAAAAILVACLGDRLPEVVVLFEVADMYRVRSALREALCRGGEQETSAATASAPSSGQDLCTRGAADLRENEYEDTDEAARTGDAGVAVESCTAGEEALRVEDSAAADLTMTAKAADAPSSACMTANDSVTAVQAFSDAADDPLETAFAALPSEQRAIDRDYVMRCFACGDPPPANPSRFLQRFLDASEAEQKAFRARRAAEPILQAA